jgi:hypothetical protein
MNDLDLMRRFRSHVQPPDPERVAAARATLRAHFDQAPSPRRRRVRPRPVIAAVSVPAIGALAVVLIAGALGGSATGTADAAIIRHADAALSPPANKILHTKVEGDGFVAEWWQLTSPPYSFVGDKGPVGAAPDQAGDATTISYYDPRTNTIHSTPSATRPVLNDPLVEIRRSLQDGRARVLGSAQIDGKPAYEIQFGDPAGFDSQSLIAYVDKSTYRPIMLSDPQRNGSIVHLRVVTLEYLPVTARNLRSLSLPDRHRSAQLVSEAANSLAPGGK